MIGHRQTPHRRQRGFTIVELLIVIIVIAVLAAIVVVAYTGITQRAYFTSYRTDLENLNKAILMYYTEHGTYPGTGSTGSCWTDITNGNDVFIPNIVPSYINQIPAVPNWSNGKNYYAYCWSTNYTDYKLIRLVPGGVTVPQAEQDQVAKDPSLGMDPTRPGRSWGIWSSGGSGL